MISIEVYLNRDFMRKNILPAQGFEPLTFWLMSSCLGITFLTGIFIPICGMISTLLEASTLGGGGDLRAVIKTTHMAIDYITQNLYIQ